MLTAGNSVVAERAGGAVRFPSGRVQRYGTLNQGTPQVGRRYALFLKRSEEEQGFLILTAYELRQGYVFPLDGQGGSGSKTNLAFSAYEGTEESLFLDALREKRSHSHPKRQSRRLLGRAIDAPATPIKIPTAHSWELVPLVNPDNDDRNAATHYCVVTSARWRE